MESGKWHYSEEREGVLPAAFHTAVTAGSRAVGTTILYMPGDTYGFPEAGVMGKEGEKK